MLILAFSAGCSPIQTDIAGLLDAPRLTTRQMEVLDALQNEVGQSIKLKYPKSGDYRSAFIFFDIDGDGNEEAIVLYAVQSGNTEVTRVVVLDNDNPQGTWKAAGGSGSHQPGLGPDIDFIRFEQLKPGDGKNMIIGWIPEGQDKIAAVYRYEQGTFQIEYSEDYSEIGIWDFNEDGLTELMFLSAPDTGALPYAILAGLTEDGLINTLDEVLLDDRIISIYEPVCGTVSPGIQGAVIDCYVRSNTMATVIIQVIGDQVIVPSDENEQMLFLQSYRTTGVRSEDIDSDGMIEIPLQVYPQGQEALDEADRIYYTDYVTLFNTTFRPVSRAYVNLEQGYRFFLPESWVENDTPVTIMRLQENGEVIFYLPREGSGVALELLRLRMMDSQGYPDKLETKSYIALNQRGSFHYYAWIADTIPEELIITEDDLKELFFLIS